MSWLMNVAKSNVKYKIESTKVYEGKLDDNDKVIVFIGPTGSGKSRLINYVTKTNIVRSEMSLQSVTYGTKMIKVDFSTSRSPNVIRSLFLFDTMGLMDTKLSDAKVLEIIKSDMDKGLNKVTLFVLVLRQGRLTDDQRKAVENIIDKFDLSKNERKVNVLIAVTHCDTMSKSDFQKVYDEYRGDKTIAKIHNCMNVRYMNNVQEEDNLFCCGLPDLNTMDDDFKPVFQKRMEQQFDQLWYCLNVGYEPIKPVDNGWCSIL
jgi:predicted GTPase